MSSYMRPHPPPGERPIRDRFARSQRGGTLVEVLVAVTILSVLMLGVIGGMTTTVKVSSSTGQLAATRAALEAATDRLSTMPYPGCVPDLTQLTTLVRAAGVAPDGFTVDVIAVTYLVPAAPTCTAATGAQMLSIRLTQTTGGRRATGDVVLRNPAARPSA